MKKLLLSLLCTGLILGNIGFAQSATTKMAATETPTAANVLKWTKEVLPKMDPLVPKLEKIKADNPGTKRSSDALRLLATVNHLKAINVKGATLKSAEAKKYYDLVVATVNSFFIDCQSHNGNVCCMDCHNHGFLGIWCFANCFTIGLPPGGN